MINWNQLAEEKETQTLSAWGLLLKKHLKNQESTLYKNLSLRGQLKGFLLVQQEAAKSQYDRMVEQGADPNLARETVLSEMFEGLTVPEKSPEDKAMEDSEEEENAEEIIDSWLDSTQP